MPDAARADAGGAAQPPVEVAPARARRPSLRNLVRVVHSDLGHFAVGLTLVYAASGIAVNHIADWDPNFTSYSRTHELGAPLAGDDRAIARAVLDRLAIPGEPSDVYRASADQLDIVLDKRTLHVTPSTGRVFDEGQEPRFLLRVANWLHLNRGKKAWTYVADAYAGGLLVLSLTGVLMLPGRRGLVGRGGVWLVLGALIPILYVHLSGGP
ncbi:MAG: hypothetical protein IT372_04765 [Polyangiaceae bacterium]|nr:hypothetical protein [Polyangiaceae bacterium]